MGILGNMFLIIVLAYVSVGESKLNDICNSYYTMCEDGQYCFRCEAFSLSRCVRKTATNPFKLVNNSLPFNKYAYLTTHNAFAIGFRLAPYTNQEDSITEQLQNGVRALMLDIHDYWDDIYLCHGECAWYKPKNIFGKALSAFKEIEAFLSSNPSEIVTLILEDNVKTYGLKNVFDEAGLMKYWFPVSRTPKNGKDWPLVSDMVKKNHRLLVFTSAESKQKTEGIAYQWNFMVENKYGDDGMKEGSCTDREGSFPLDDKSKSLVLLNYFPSNLFFNMESVCKSRFWKLKSMLHTCYAKSGNRWANFLAVDYYKESDGGGAFQAIDMLNGMLMCGHSDVHACVPGS